MHSAARPRDRASGGRDRVATPRGRAARAAERGAMSIVKPLFPILDRLPRVSSALGETTLISPPSGSMALSRLPCKLPHRASHPLKLEFGTPSSTRSPMRFTVSLRREAAANTSTPTAGSTKGNASDRPSHPRANKPNRRGMVTIGQGIPAPLARPGSNRCSRSTCP